MFFVPQKHLQDLHKNVYQKDIVERYRLKDDEVLSAIVNALASVVSSLRNTGDSCRKIVILDGNQLPWADEDSVVYTGVIPFMLDAKSIERIVS